MSWSCACSPKTAPKNVSAHGKSPFYSPIHQGLSPGLPPLSPLALPRAGEGNGQSHPVPKLILSSLPDHSNTADELSALDEWFINQTFKLKDKLLLTPIHTNFRVFAVIAYRTTSGERRYVTGTNTETCFIGTTICAERSAVMKLRHEDFKCIDKLYLTSDLHQPLLPGVLCREFLLEFITTDTPIICAAKLTHPKPTDKAWKHKIVRLRDIYPFPPLYLGVQGNHVVEYGSALARANITPHELRTVCGSDGRWEELYQKVKAATQLDTRSHIHPLQYAGGVMFENGDMKVVWASKQLEFGGTIDVISKLSPYLEDYNTRGIKPVLMMMCDQFGILHLPFAPARGYLVEMENQAFYDCKIPFHYYPSDSDAGSGAAAGGEKETAKLVLQTLTVKELVPDNCVFDDFLEKSSNRDMNLDLHGDASHADDADGAADDDVGAMRSLSLTASSTNTMTSSSILSSASSAKQSLSSRLPSLSSLLSYGTFFVASVGIGYMFGSQQRSRPGTLASTQTQ